MTIAAVREVLDLIPDSVLGAAFALLGVHFTNRSAERRHREQLEHDRAARKDERERTLRKEVYLAAAEGIAAGLQLLPRLSQIEVSSNELAADYLSKSAAIAKVDIIASESAIGALVNFSSQFEAAYLRLILLRGPLEADQRTIDGKRAFIPLLEKQRDLAIDEINRLRMEGVSDQAQWERLQAHFRNHVEFIDKAIADVELLQKDLAVKRLEFYRECMLELQKLRPAMIALLVEARKDLGLPIDEQEYARLLDERGQAALAQISSFVEEMKRRIPQPPA